MDDELFEKEVKSSKEPNLVINLVVFGVLGVIFGLVLYLIGVYSDLNLIIITFFIGALAGFLFYAISLLPEDTRHIVYLIFYLGLFIIVAIFVWQNEPISSFVSTVGGSLKGAFSWVTCLTNPEACAGIEELESPSASTTRMAAESFFIDVSYKNDNIEEDGSFNLFIGLNVVNTGEKNLEVYPSCKGHYSKKNFDVMNLQGYSKGNYFSFPTSNKEMKAGFWCSGNVEQNKERIIIRLSVQALSISDWFITVGREGEGGERIEKKGPFSLIPEIFANMPLKNGEYDLFLKLKPLSGFKLDRLISFNVEATPGTEVDCNIDESNIEDYWDSKENAYVFNCKLYISEAPQKQEQRVIKFTANYLMYKEFEKEIRKKES